MRPSLSGKSSGRPAGLCLPPTGPGSAVVADSGHQTQLGACPCPPPSVWGTCSHQLGSLEGHQGSLQKGSSPQISQSTERATRQALFLQRWASPVAEQSPVASLGEWAARRNRRASSASQLCRDTTPTGDCTASPQSAGPGESWTLGTVGRAQWSVTDWAGGDVGDVCGASGHPVPPLSCQAGFPRGYGSGCQSAGALPPTHLPWRWC